jgi:hypothetical protein
MLYKFSESFPNGGWSTISFIKQNKTGFFYTKMGKSNSIYVWKMVIGSCYIFCCLFIVALSLSLSLCDIERPPYGWHCHMIHCDRPNRAQTCGDIAMEWRVYNIVCLQFITSVCSFLVIQVKEWWLNGCADKTWNCKVFFPFAFHLILKGSDVWIKMLIDWNCMHLFGR